MRHKIWIKNVILIALILLTLFLVYKIWSINFENSHSNTAAIDSYYQGAEKL